MLSLKSSGGSEQSDGWDLFRENSYLIRDLGDKLFSELGNLPPAWRKSFADSSSGFMSKDPEKWFRADLAGLGFDEQQAAKIRGSAIMSMIGRDPEGAIRLLNSGMLTESQAERSISNFFDNLASDPTKAGKLLLQLSSEDQRQIARAAIDKGSKMATSQNMTPTEWIEKIGAGGISRNESIRSMSSFRNWSLDAMEDLQVQFQSMSDERKKKEIAQALSRNMISSAAFTSLRGEAVSYMISHPDSSSLPDSATSEQQAADISYAASSYAAEEAIQNRTRPATGLIPFAPERLRPGRRKTWVLSGLSMIRKLPGAGSNLCRLRTGPPWKNSSGRAWCAKL